MGAAQWNFADVWVTVAACLPERSALVHGHGRITWAGQGGAPVDSGTVAGVVSIAAPIFGADGRIAAALSIGGPTVRLQRQLRTLKAAVRDGAEEISRLLGYVGDWPAAPQGR